MSIPLIIDTDVALGIRHEGRPRDIDDGFAIAEALNTDAIDLLGITTIYGNAPHADVFRVANEIVTLKDADVPVIAGAESPMPQTGAVPSINAAVEFLAEQLAAQRLKIAAIGPLTNVGLLAHHFPEHVGNIDELIIVAGRSRNRPFFIGNSGPVNDFNFENDPRAARLLLEMERPTVLAGFELTSQVAVTPKDLGTIRNHQSPTSDYFHRNSLDWVTYWTDRFPTDAGFHPWDSAAISLLTHPEYFQHEPRGWRITHRADAPWLECDSAFPGFQVTFCTGFAPGAAARFVADIASNVY